MIDQFHGVRVDGQARPDEEHPRSVQSARSDHELHPGNRSRTDRHRARRARPRPRSPGGCRATSNQNIPATQTGWAQQLEIALTPWGFLKGAAANSATAQSQRVDGRNYTVVSYNTTQKAPSGQAYAVTGYINEQNEIERVETRVDNPVVGDLLVENVYSGYQTFGTLKVPTRITQRRAGFPIFEATITSATANPANLTALLTPPPPPGRAGGAGAAARRPRQPLLRHRRQSKRQKLADGLFRITGGYVAIAADMGDHIVVLEGPQNEARAMAVIAAAKAAIPGKPIRFVVNTHPRSSTMPADSRRLLPRA